MSSSDLVAPYWPHALVFILVFLPRTVDRGLGQVHDNISRAIAHLTSARAGVPPVNSSALLGVVLMTVGFLIVMLIDWVALTLSLQVVLGISSGQALGHQFVRYIEYGLAAAVLLPAVLGVWYGAELFGHLGLLQIRSASRAWTRVQHLLAWSSVGGAVVAALLLAVFRSSAVEQPAMVLAHDEAVGIAKLTAISTGTMVALSVALLSSAALAFEAGPVGALRIVPQALVRIVLSGGLAAACLLRALSGLARGVAHWVAAVCRPLAAMLVMALVRINTWGQHQVGRWRFLAVPLVVITMFVRFLEVNLDPTSMGDPVP